MIRFTLLSLVGAAALLISSSTSQAQIYVPHTTTHIDLVPHRGHYDAVPHTTTHYDAVPVPSYRSNYGSGFGLGLGYNTGFGSSYQYNTGRSSYYAPQYGAQYGSHYGGGYSVQRPVYPNHQHSSTHLDVVPHRGHYHVVPHTTHRRF